jgi:hypothetical protein
VESESNDARDAWQYFSAPRSDSARESEIEFALVGSLGRSIRRGQGETKRPQNAQPALDSIRPNRIRDSEQTATRIMGFVSFHGATMKPGVGH